MSDMTKPTDTNSVKAAADAFFESLAAEGVTARQLDTEILYISTGEDACRMTLRKLFANLFEMTGSGDGSNSPLTVWVCVEIAEGLHGCGFWSGTLGLYSVCIVPVETARTLIDGEALR